MSENNSDRAPGVSRRGVLAATGTASVALVAGCSGGGDDTETAETAADGDETLTETADDETPTETADDEMSTATADDETSTETARQSVSGTASSSVEELAIVEHQPDPDYREGSFGLDVTVENNGDQQADASDYEYELTPYDADGNDVSGNSFGTSSNDDAEMNPGGRGSLTAHTAVEIDQREVDRYEVTLVCPGFGPSGVYCQPEEDEKSTEEDETPPEEDETSSSASGTASNSVQQLAIVDHEPADSFADDNTFGVELTVENNGEQETNLDNYFYIIVPYDVDGNDVSNSWTGPFFGDTPSTIGPGEQLTFFAFLQVTTSASEVDRYELTLTCTSTVTGYEAEGVYCD